MFRSFSQLRELLIMRTTEPQTKNIYPSSFLQNHKEGGGFEIRELLANIQLHTMSNCYCWHFFCNHISYPVELSLLQLSSKNTLVLNFPPTNYIVPQKEYRGIRELQHVPSCVGVLKQGEKQVPQSSFLSFFPSFQISFFSWANCSST